MLYQISIENFFSIADRQVMNLEVPKNAPDLPCFSSSHSDSDIRLPTVIGVFGSNASGKSTVLRAIISAFLFCIHSFDWQPNAFAPLFQPYIEKKHGLKNPLSLELNSKAS